MATKKEKMPKELNIEKKYLILIALVGLLGYVSYFLKISNYYNLIIGIIFLVALIKNFNGIKGISVFICLMLLNIFGLPLTIYLSKSSGASKFIIFAVNFILIVLVIIGIRKLKKWAFYLALFLIAFSSISLISLVLTLIYSITFSVQPALILINNFLSLIILILFFIYLIRSKKYFEMGEDNVKTKKRKRAV